MASSSKSVSPEIRHASEHSHPRIPMPSLGDVPRQTDRARCSALPCPGAAATQDAERTPLGRTSQGSRTASNRRASKAPPQRIQCRTFLPPISSAAPHGPMSTTRHSSEQLPSTQPPSQPTQLPLRCHRPDCPTACVSPLTSLPPAAGVLRARRPLRPCLPC